MMKPAKNPEASELKLRERFGILQTAPGGRWKADALPEGTLNTRGSIDLSEDSGVRLYSGATASEPLDWESPDQSIDLAAWLDASRLIVSGWSAVDHPRISGKYVQFGCQPCGCSIWARTLRRFQGPPSRPGFPISLARQIPRLPVAFPCSAGIAGKHHQALGHVGAWSHQSAVHPGGDSRRCHPIPQVIWKDAVAPGNDRIEARTSPATSAIRAGRLGRISSPTCTVRTPCPVVGGIETRGRRLASGDSARPGDVGGPNR
jgi:hypothetical protein